jgi:hypothetical protein
MENPAIIPTDYTSTGGSLGTSALDGYAAAIEVYLYFAHSTSIYTDNVLGILDV